MHWYEPEVASLEKTPVGMTAGAGGVVFYGSSSVRLWGALAEDFPEWAPLNRGFGGSTLAACVHFFPRLVLPLRPRLLIVYAGDNDLGDGAAPTTVAGDLARLVHTAQHAWGRVPLWFLAIKPSPARWALQPMILECNRLCSAEIERVPGARWIDTHTPLLRRDGRPRSECYEADGLHLSRAGYVVWRDTLRAAAGLAPR
ncbi:MAG TPA: GDSL-type esterase/lipase family protein [Opitutaceae bacterium]